MEDFGDKVAARTPIDEDEDERDARDLLYAIEHDGGVRYSMDEVMEMFG